MHEQSQEKTAIGTSKEAVISIPPEYVHFDQDFPAIPIEHFADGEGNMPELATTFAKQYADSRTIVGDHSGTIEATKYLGRASTSEPGVVLSTTDGMRTIVSIKTKPTGVPDIVRQSWDDYKGKAEPFFHHVPTQPHGDARTDLVKREAFLGLGSHVKERQRQDAANSLLLHQIGVKTRLPISGWSVDAFMVWDDLEQKLVPRDVEWFKQQGLDDDELYQAAWGLSCPTTLEDVNDFLSSTADLPEDRATPLFVEFVTAMKDLAQKDISPEYQALSEDLKAVFNSGNELDLTQVAEVLKMFGLALARTAGKNYERMYRNETGKSYTHGVLHDQNISFFGEWCDSFTLKEGLLEIGLAPENSGDISGLMLALRRFAVNILIIQGEPANIETVTKALSYAEEVFYPELLANWPSYRDYCLELHEAEIQQYLINNAGSFQYELENSGLDDNEENRKTIANNKIGGIRWPLGKPNI